MITRNEKAKGLWWRLLATLPVLALLLIANSKVAAQEQKTNVLPEQADSYQIVMYEYEGEEALPFNDTVIYNEDGSWSEVKREKEMDPETNQPRTKVMISSYDKDGKPTAGFHIQSMPREDDIKEFKITANEGFTYPVKSIKVHNNDSIYQVVDEIPQFPGGEAKLMEYIANNITYPQEARDKEIAGRVFVSFVVEKDGSISNVKVLRGIGGGCDEESARVISTLPKWKPGMKDGKPVRVSYQIPINFKLDDGQPANFEKKKEASQPDMTPDKNYVYQTVEEMPEFPGGVEAMMDYVAKSVVYPQEAMDNEISGRVLVRFVIEKDGSITEVEVLKGIGGGCDEEAVRVVKTMPKWKPGKQDGQPVRVSFTMPFTFKLQ